MATITGASNRFVAEVDNTNRLETRTISESEFTDAVLRGDGYVITTGLITLTDDAKSALAIFENREDRDVVITGLRINIGPGAQADSVVELDFAVGVDMAMAGGAGVEVGQSNLIVGNTALLDSNSELGQQGAAIVGGNSITTFERSGLTENVAVFYVFPKGGTMAASVTPPAGNTNIQIGVDVVVYLDRGDS